MGQKKVIECIKRNKNFLITTHRNLEGDALGSELVLFRLLKCLGKNATIINEDDAPYEYSFLPGINNIKKFRNDLKDVKFDCFVILDSSNLTRCGQVYKININNKPILNIDHHISNEKFGDINWVEPDSSSCVQMIYKLYKKLHIPLEKDIATNLYVGIVADTGSFRYSNTSSLTHKVVSECLRFNLDVAKIYNNIYGDIPFSDMKLLIKILPSIRCLCAGKIVYFTIRSNMLENKKITFDLTENILNFARAIKDVEVAVLFKENLGVKDETRVNLRSQGKVDVNKIARFFGGGGHRRASGCTIQGEIGKVRKNVLNKIKESLE